MSGDDRGPEPEVKTGIWKTEHTFMNIRPAGLSDEEVKKNKNFKKIAKCILL